MPKVAAKRLRTGRAVAQKIGAHWTRWLGIVRKAMGKASGNPGTNAKLRKAMGKIWEFP